MNRPERPETYKEPPIDLLISYFKEIREGRSRKSVVNALRRKGYTISETVLRHRYEVWLAYQQAKEEFEKRLNQVKGEILEKTNRELTESLREISPEILEVKTALHNLLGENTYAELATPFGNFPEGFLWSIVNELRDENEYLKQQVDYLYRENRKLKQQIKTISKVLWSILEGIYQREKKSGFLERKDLWESISESGLTQNLIDEIQELASNR